MGKFQHETQRCHVVGFPAFTTDKARQYVGDTKEQQRNARYAPHSTLGNDRGVRVVHAGRKNVSEKKGSTEVRAAFDGQFRPEPEGGLLGCSFAETVAEFLNASAHIVHRLLCAGIERMRLASGIQLDVGQLAAVFHLDHFFGIGARTGYELEAVGHVLEAHVAVIGVNAFFHIFSISCDSRASLSGVLAAKPMIIA
jgi:hypothetical protein